MKTAISWWAATCALCAGLAACSSDDAPGGSGAGGTAGSGGTNGGDTDAGLRRFTPPSTRPGPSTALITATGEVLALTGYPFPPATPDDPAFVDGWEIHFDHLLATIGKITLSSDPDRAPGDPSQVGGVVAEAAGPFAVDLAEDSPGNIDGEGDPGTRAVPLAVLERQNRAGDAAFATDGTRYAFGYDVVAADARAYDVNLDADANALYRAMIAQGCTVLYEGTATFKGSSCRTYANTAADGGADPFERIPKQVHFSLCFKAPTSYVNCQNGANDPADPFPGEAHQRGIAFKANTFVVGQATLHTDHPFWESTTHDSPAHFDPIAARAVGKQGAPPLVDMSDLAGLDFGAFSDAEGAPLVWRSCLPPEQYAPPGKGTVSFDPRSVPVTGPGGEKAIGLRDYADFVTYNVSTQGHLNIEDGLCFVKRGYPSPP